jgi:ribosomal protein S18 acetylase RimI-like enzyme
MNIHKEKIVQFTIELLQGYDDQLRKNYQIDSVSIIGQSIQKYVNDHLIENFIKIKPPNGIIYMLEVNGNAVGMGAIEKLSDKVAEVKRQYIRPQYRGKGYGKKLFNKVLDSGRKYGCSTFRLSTPKFAHAAQHIYKSAGFKEIKAYPETIIPPIFHKYWLWMEKKE